MNGVCGTIFAGRTTDFFLKDARKANGVRIAHLAANQIEFIVGFANQTAGFGCFPPTELRIPISSKQKTAG